MIITDAVMPGTGAGLIVQHLETMTTPPALLIISGYVEDELLRRGIETASLAFLQKPFSGQQLYSKLETLLGAGGRRPPEA